MPQSIGLENFRILQSIFDASKDSIAALDMNWKFLAFNDAWQKGFQRVSGVSVELGMNVKDAIVHNTALYISFTTQWERALRGEAFVETLNPPTQPDVYIEMTFNPLYNEQNELLGCSQIVRNVTERVKNQRELQQRKQQLEVTINQLQKEIADHAVDQAALMESEFLHKTLNELTQTFTWKFDLSGHFKLVNLSWGQVTGQTLEQSEGLGWIEAIHPDEREKLSQLWTKTQEPCQSTFRVWCFHEQTYKHAKIFFKPLHNANGNIVEWIAAGIDVHELMQTKQDLNIASSRLNLALKTAQIGVFERQLNSNEVLIDELDAEILGVDFTATKGKLTLEEFCGRIHPDDRELVTNEAKRLRAEKRGSADVHFRVTWPDDSLRWVSGRAEFHSYDGRECIIGTHQDVTQKKLMEEQKLLLLSQAEEIKLAKQTELLERHRAEAAEENKKRQEEFIDTICHEIRNPLSGVQGCITLLKEELDSSFETKDKSSKDRSHKVALDLLDCMMECVHQQKVIVDDALDLSKLETSKLVLYPSAFLLKGLLHSVLQMHNATAVQKGIYLTTQIQDESLWIVADRERIKQALVNLVSNAVKFTDQGGITVKVFAENLIGNDLKMTIQVEDTGMGVAPSDVALLYTKFSQLRRTTEHNKPGSGLGLAITKHLVTSMGGEVGFHHRKGGGSVFFFVIPCKVAQPGVDTTIEKEGGEQVENATSPRTVLIVDDSKLNQKILASYVEKDGHSYEVASNGQEAVEICQHKYFDIIFMDVEMPIMNGYEATQFLRQKEATEHHSHPYYIVGLSGNARKEKVEEALKSGMDLYLTKPYHKADILRTVRSAPTRCAKRKRNE